MMTIATAGVLLPLTHPQKRIWYIEQLYPGTTVHHICGTAMMHGAVDEDRLRRAVELVLCQHAALRIRLVMKEGEVYQTIHPPVPPAITRFDCRHSRHPEQALQDWLQEAIRMPFELLSQELYQFSIFRTAAGKTGLFVKIHHLIFDGWSTQLFTQALSRSYTILADRDKSDLPELADVTYLELLDREASYLTSSRIERDRMFWLEQFNEVPPLPFHDSPDWRKGGRWSMELSVPLATRALEWTEATGVSLHELFGLVLQMGMSCTYGVRDFTLGIPVYNRSSREEKAAIGMYVSTMPLRCTLNDEATALQQLKRLRRQFKLGYLHQKYPYDLLVHQLRDRLPEGEGLFQVCLNTYVFNPHERLGEEELISEELYKGEQLYPLELIVKNWGDGQVRLDLDYKLALFTRKQMDSFGRQLSFLLEEVLDRPHDALQELVMAARLRLDHSSKVQVHRTVMEALHTSAERFPLRIALRDGKQILTYAELVERARSMADWLAEHGVCRGHRVGIYSEHRMDSVTAIWAVLSLGAAYVPMDVRHPAGRLADVLTDSQCVLVLVDRELPAAAWECAPGSVLRLDDWRYSSGDTEESVKSNIVAAPDDLAYIIYTSGSTGKPKGVMIEHGSLLAYADWAAERYMRDETDIFALYSSPAFDLTVTSIFAPLIAGGAIEIYRQPSDNVSVLPGILAGGRATVLKLTPAHLALLREGPPVSTTLHTLIVGGEALSVSLARQASEALGGPRIYNEYGPTEATVGCMIHLFDSRSDQEADVPIGVAAAPARLYLLEADGRQAATGSPGELCVAGAGVARGYRGQEGLTAERFLPEPGYPDSRMYRTGDLAVLDARGRYRYLGRIDDQIKLSGYRIEPGEIERQLQRQPGIQEAAVVLKRSANDHAALLAYVTGDAGLREEALRRTLGEQLPAYMVPAHIIRLEALPLTPSGKVDRRQLAENQLEHSTVVDEMMQVNSLTARSATAAGESPIRTLLTLARTLLRNDRLGEEDDFYREGGDSIKAIQLSSRLQDTGWLLTPSEVLEAATFGAMAQRMSPVSAASGDSLPVAGKLSLPPIAAWFAGRHFPEPHYWNQSVLLTVDNAITPVMVEEALARLVRHHDSLRLNMNRTEAGRVTGLRYNPDSLDRRFRMSHYDLSFLTGDRLEEAIRESAIVCKSQFDLNQGLLFAACWLELGARGNRLLLTAHHLVVDAVSWLILTADLEQLLDAMLQGHRVELAAKSASYADWSGALVDRAAVLKPEDLSYWQPWEGVGDGADCVRKIEDQQTHADAKRQGCDTRERPGSGRVETVASEPTEGEARLSAADTSLWLGEANDPYRTEPMELLLAALAGALLEEPNAENQDSLVIQMERHGREPISGALDLTRTVGWFTTLYPLLLNRSELSSLVLSDEELSPDQQRLLEQSIMHIKEQIRSVPRQGVDYGIARYLSGRNEIVQQSEPRVMFNYLGELATGGTGRLLELATEATGPDSHPANGAVCDIEALAWTASGRLHLTVRTAEGERSAACRLSQRWSEGLQQVLRHCANAEDGRFTKADFDTVELSQDELEGLFHE